MADMTVLDYAMMVEDSHVSTRIIEYRRRTADSGITGKGGDLIAVVDGLKPGEEIVTSGLLKLRNDAEVTINNSVQPAANAQPAPANR